MLKPLVRTAIHRVTRLGQPILRERTRSLTAKEIKDPSLQRLIDEMAVTMVNYAGVGIAAPQVGQGMSLFLMGFPKKNEDLAEDEKHEEGIELTAVINPKIRIIGSEKEEDWEGCLSVPGLRGLVTRFKKLELSGLNQNGKPFTRRYEGFPARVVQHEMDHLDGKVYLDRMNDLTSLAYTDETVRE